MRRGAARRGTVKAIRWEATQDGETRGLFQALHTMEKARHSVDAPPTEIRRDESLRYAFTPAGEDAFLANLSKMRKIQDDREPYKNVEEWAREDLAGGWEPQRREVEVVPVWQDEHQVAYRP